MWHKTLLYYRLINNIHPTKAFTEKKWDKPTCSLCSPLRDFLRFFEPFGTSSLRSALRDSFGFFEPSARPIAEVTCSGGYAPAGRIQINLKNILLKCPSKVMIEHFYCHYPLKRVLISFITSVKGIPAATNTSCQVIPTNPAALSNFLYSKLF